MATTAMHPSPVPRARLILGATVFLSGQLAPLAIPLVISAELPTAWTTIISGALLAGVPELAIIIAIAILGKEGYTYLKHRFKRFFQRVVPERVSRVRHRVGIVMLTLTLVVGWVSPYALMLLELPTDIILPLAIGGDVLLIVSLLILGWGFWEKLRSLFTYSSEPPPPEP